MTPHAIGEQIRGRLFAPRSGRWLLVCLTMVLGFRLLLAVIVVPPWQQPDEPAHFLLASILAGQETRDLSRRTDPRIEREILESMARHDWWRYYGRSRPNPLPSDLTSAGLSVVDSGPTAYYVAAAAVLRALGIERMLDQLYTLRGLSALFSVLALWCGWAGTRRLFGDVVANVATALIAVHPQFALVAASAGPAAAVSLCGAVVWWQAGAVMTSRRRLRPACVMWAAAMIAVFAKREGLPLAAISAVVTFVALGQEWMHNPARTRMFGFAAVVAVVSGAAVWLLASDEIDQVVYTLRRVLIRGMDPESASWEYFWRFSVTLFDSAWMLGGWARYPAPLAWAVAVRVLAAVSVVGLMLLAWRRPGPTLAAAVGVAVVLVMIQTASIYSVHFRLHISPQGRYLFPVMAPAMALFWVGFRSWWPAPQWPVVAGTLLSVLVLLDLIGWSTLLIPTFVG